MTIQHIDFTPCAGLANRMRSIASALSAAQELGCTSVCIYWKLEPSFAAPFGSIFDALRLPSWIQVVEVPPSSRRDEGAEVLSEAEWQEYIAKQKAAGTTRLVFKSWAAFFDANASTWSSMRPKSLTHSPATTPQPSERWLANLRTLLFLPELYERARAAIGNRTHTAGVHIRRTDHFQCIRASPSAAFWDGMAAEDGSVHFYVASDDMSERREALRRFPVRTCVSPQPYRERHTREGSIDGAVEFLTLTLCTHLIGSYLSSFSELAAVYGGIPLKLVRG
jgi:hypothetical protein